jgi:hypothetical protein
MLKPPRSGNITSTNKTTTAEATTIPSQKEPHRTSATKRKYLPQTLECVFSLIRIDDMNKFKEGIKESLWNCDMCSYNIDEEKIEIYNDLELGFTHIKFQYDPTTNQEIE